MSKPDEKVVWRSDIWGLLGESFGASPQLAALLTHFHCWISSDAVGQNS